MSYTHLTRQERAIIGHLRMRGFTVAAIGRELGRAASTIHRELARTKDHRGRYKACLGDSQARGRRRRAKGPWKLCGDLLAEVIRLLQLDYSPEQISGWLKSTTSWRISHEAIYRHIWADKAAGGVLYLHLRQSSKQRRKRYRSSDSRGVLRGKRHISERPASAEDKQEFGHWEVDTMVGPLGSKACLVTLTERATNYVVIGYLDDRKKETVNRRLEKLLRREAGLPVRSITADNGIEFHGYEALERKAGVTFYFATPYHSWERGSNENANGLIRQYVPKGESIRGLGQWSCNKISDRLNSRPRKRHGFRSPNEMLGYYGLR